MPDVRSDVLENAKSYAMRLERSIKTLKVGRPASPDLKSRLEKAVSSNADKKATLGETAPLNDQEKSDSEAETIVPGGKGETVSPEKRKIQHKRSSTDGPRTRHDPGTDLSRQDPSRNSVRTVSLKRKRPEPSSDRRTTPDGATSSLSSRYSSPVHETTSSKRSVATSERSRSSPPSDAVIQEKLVKPKKRKHRASEDGEATSRGKSDADGDPVRRPKKQRDVRSATHDEFSTHRSESPHLPQQIRAQSSQADIQSTVRKRKPTLDLHLERRRRVSEDPSTLSDDARSARDLPALRTAHSIDQQIMSARAPQRKNRDKSGRTLLAKACNGDVDEVEARLRDRPEDINVADYAGNTPLQIASLAGCEDIVRLLIKEGCDIHCKNVDLDTPLIDAVENGHLEVVKVLLDAGVDPRQGNEMGAEPLELLGEQHDDHDAIRDALLAAMKRDSRRRQSRDFGAKAHDDQSTSAGSPTDQTPMSAFAGEQAGRRKTARSQPTRGDTLYTHATPERLREAAAKGDAQVVVQILEMGLLRVDAESMIAATKGGHDEVLGYLIAMGQPNPDPNPIHTASGHEAYSTPVLAAIGRKNIKPLDLLIGQPGFDPTRRLLDGKAYHELAEDRQGPNWQLERDMLRKAYDQWKGVKGGSVQISPRKLKRRKAIDALASPRTQRSVESKSPIPDDGGTLASKVKNLKASSFNGQKSAHASNPGSDLEQPTAHNRKKVHTAPDVEGDAMLPLNADPNKPKRRLMSKNEIESSQEQRRASLAVDAPLSKEREMSRKASDPTSPKDHKDKTGHLSGTVGSKNIAAKAKRVDLTGSKGLVKPKHEESMTSKDKIRNPSPVPGEAAPAKDLAVRSDRPSSPKKRPRLSDSPKRSRESDPLIKKRRRADSQTSADVPSRPPAPMIPITSSKSATAAHPKTESQARAAPTAFMGGSSTSFESATVSPSTLEETYRQSLQAQTEVDQAALQRERVEETKDIVTNAEWKEDANPFTTSSGLSPVRQEKEIQAIDDKARKEAVIAPEKYAAQEEARRQAKLAEEELQRERELKEKLKLEKEEAQRAAEETRQREAEAADILAAQRKQREKDLEALRKRQVEQEKEEEQKREQIRQRQKEVELERQRQQEAAEAAAAAAKRHRLQSLPDSFQDFAILPRSTEISHQQMVDCLPLKAGRMRNMYPDDHPKELADELWICNLQAALVLGTIDVELRDCTFAQRFFCSSFPARGSCVLVGQPMLTLCQIDLNLSKRPCTPAHLQALWRTLRTKLMRPGPGFVPGSAAASTDLEFRGKAIFSALAKADQIFWIPLQALLDAASSIEHLSTAVTMNRLRNVQTIAIPSQVLECFDFLKKGFDPKPLGLLGFGGAKTA